MRIINDHLLTSTEKTLIDEVLNFKFLSRSFFFDSLAGSLEIEIDPDQKIKDGAPIDRQEIADALRQAEKELKMAQEDFNKVRNSGPSSNEYKAAEEKLGRASSRVYKLKGYMNESNGPLIVPQMELSGEFVHTPAPKVIIYLGSFQYLTNRNRYKSLIAVLVHELFHAFNFFEGGGPRSVREVDEPMVEFAAGVFLKAMSQTNSSFNEIYSWHKNEVYSKTTDVGEIVCYGFGRYLMDNVATESTFSEDEWIGSYARLSSSINPTLPIVSVIKKALYPFYPTQSESKLFKLIEKLVFPTAAKKKGVPARPMKAGTVRRFYTITIKGISYGPYKMWEVIREFIIFRLNNGVPFSVIYNEISKGKMLIANTPRSVSRATGKIEGNEFVYKGNSYYVSTQLRDNNADANFRKIKDYINNNYPDFQITDLIKKNHETNVVIVDYTAPYESFGWRGSIHIEIDLNNKTLSSGGWRNGTNPLSEKETQKYLDFFSDINNLNDFFDDRKAFSTPVDHRFEHYRQYELKIQWNGRKKAISVGYPDIPFQHPFGMY